MAKAVTSATTPTRVTEEAHPLSGSLTFYRRRITRHEQKGGRAEHPKKVVLNLDLNDQIDLTDAGAAMLRGFDIPAFRKEIHNAKSSRVKPDSYQIEELYGVHGFTR